VIPGSKDILLTAFVNLSDRVNSKVPHLPNTGLLSLYRRLNRIDNNDKADVMA
jgi:predicted nucleotidyltransferase